MSSAPRSVDPSTMVVVGPDAEQFDSDTGPTHAAEPLHDWSEGDQLVETRERLRAAFAARYGPELGEEVAAETMVWAMEHPEKLSAMTNPAGYLFRVGQSKARRLLRWSNERVRFPAESIDLRDNTHWVEPALPTALTRLDEISRTSIVLVHCFQWTYPEVAELLDVPLHTVRNRIHRGLAQLREDLE